MTRCRNGTRMWNIFLKPNAKPTCSGYDEWQKGCAAAKVHVMPKAEPKSFEIYRMYRSKDIRRLLPNASVFSEADDIYNKLSRGRTAARPRTTLSFVMTVLREIRTAAASPHEKVGSRPHYVVLRHLPSRIISMALPLYKATRNNDRQETLINIERL